MKRFNYTGVCIRERHYMVDVSKKIDEIIEMIDYGDYIAINKPRQYGKTTILNLLTKELKNKYLPIVISLEGNSQNTFKNIELFSKLLINSINIQLKLLEETEYLVENSNITSLLELSQIITKFVDKASKKVVLFIDEVDEASNYKLFSKFLGMLRDKYLKRNEGEDQTFHSVILAGVHDIKNLKMKIRGERELQYNSPWNIAVDFKVNMSFSSEEISTMLIDYENDHNTGMDIDFMSKKLYDYTTGYPYLVSKLCYLMDKDLKKEFTEVGLEKAIKILLNEDNTLFDDLIKNINRYEELYRLVERILLEGEEINYNRQAHHLGVMYGIFREDSKHKLVIHNTIFEILLYNYMIAMREIEKGSALSYKYRENYVDEAGDLKMELVLEKFQELMKAEYRKIDEEFVEREGRLLFLAFLKPIINGTGFYFVESETRHSNRMDIVVTYNRKKYVIELKIWRGGKYEQEGREQLAGYLEAQNLDKGYMIFYNFNKNKEYIKEKLDVDGKEIFEIVV
ncbi:MAG: AAA-like domain-containing protein [Fusobacteriota bacterium]